MKSVYRKAAESLVNRSLPKHKDYSCYHLYYHAKDGFSRLALQYKFLVCPDPVNPANPDPWWGVKQKTPEQLLAASLALLFMELIDD